MMIHRRHGDGRQAASGGGDAAFGVLAVNPRTAASLRLWRRTLVSVSVSVGGRNRSPGIILVFAFRFDAFCFGVF